MVLKYLSCRRIKCLHLTSQAEFGRKIKTLPAVIAVSDNESLQMCAFFFLEEYNAGRTEEEVGILSIIPVGRVRLWNMSFVSSDNFPWFIFY